MLSRSQGSFFNKMGGMGFTPGFEKGLRESCMDVGLSQLTVGHPGTTFLFHTSVPAKSSREVGRVDTKPLFAPES